MTTDMKLLPDRRQTGSSSGLIQCLDNAQKMAARWLSTYSIDALRISLGIVFLGFGVLKFFPGVSPAAALATRTVTVLTLGVLPGWAALLLTASMECAVGLSLLTGRFLRTGL